PYQIRSAGGCVFPCSIAGTCATCTSGFVQCVGTTDGVAICATNLNFDSTQNCPVNDCTAGYTCYSSASGGYACFQIRSTENC
ncbi:MAG TPA: hypothetical protein VFQ80_11165, partial [Thermomicrobiales bacterium]|nr:hypothetical protein [Thermomicrobiales bacterium]